MCVGLFHPLLDLLKLAPLLSELAAVLGGQSLVLLFDVGDLLLPFPLVFGVGLLELGDPAHELMGGGFEVLGPFLCRCVSSSRCLSRSLRSLMSDTSRSRLL